MKKLKVFLLMMFFVFSFGYVNLSVGNETKAAEGRKKTTLTKVEISACKIQGVDKKYVFTGKSITPKVTVTYKGKGLKKNRDYTVKYKNNKLVGSATITIKGMGKYTGSVEKKFKITRLSISSVKLTGLSQYYKYTGKTRTPAFRLKGYKNLKRNKDYTVAFYNNIEIGKATIVIKGIGNYKGSLKKNFYIVKKGFETVDGKTYCYNEKGYKYTGLADVSGNTYLFDDNGVMQTGWRKLDGKYYYFDRKNGKRLVDGSVDGISIDKDGKVDLSGKNVDKIETMMKARKVVEENTLATDTMEEKRLKVFKWVFQFSYRRFRLIKDQDDIEILFANDIFDNQAGDCVSESAAVAFMFHEIGYEEVYFCHDTGHSWVELNGRLYDPLFAEARNFNENYNAEFKDYRINPAAKIKIY